MSNSTKKRILHVEDEEQVYKLLTRVLGKYDIVNAATYRDAKTLAEKEHFDLYLIDGNFPSHEPGIPGLLFYEHIKPKNKPCVFFTNEYAVLEKARELGIPHIEKPAELGDIINTIENVLED